MTGVCVFFTFSCIPQFFIASTSAIHFLERSVSRMTHFVSIAMLATTAALLAAICEWQKNWHVIAAKSFYKVI